MSLSVCLSLSLSSLIVISYILPSQCQYRYLYFALILSSEQQRRSTGSKAGVNCSQLRGKDVKQEGESWQASFQSPSKRPHVSVSWGLLFSFPLLSADAFLFCPCTGKTVAQVRYPAENDQSFWIPRRERIDLLGSEGCACSLNDLRGWQLKDCSLTSRVSETWV